MDLLSVISGSAQDFKLILDYLPTYFPQFVHFHNVMTGISLGAHAAYRIASLAPGQFEAFAIVVGCPTLGSLLLNRLGIDPSSLGTAASELGSIPYEKLEKFMTQEQKRRYPHALAESIRAGDRKVLQEFPTDIPALICNGKLDPLVPPFYTAEWLKKRWEGGLVNQGGDRMDFFVQDNTGHSCTKEMVGMISDWLAGLFESRAADFAAPALTESRL
jgi:hypothetical protein